MVLAMEDSTITPNTLHQAFTYLWCVLGEQHNTNLWIIQMPHFSYWVVSSPTVYRYTYKKKWKELVSLHSICVLSETYEKVGSGYVKGQDSCTVNHMTYHDNLPHCSFL